MRTLLLALAATTALSAPVLAQSDPNVPIPSSEDPNMRIIDYSPHIRARLVGTIGRSTVVTFAPDEEVMRVLFGDGEGETPTWRGPAAEEVSASPLLNTIYLFPQRPGYTTIQVLTRSAAKGVRVYQFAARAKALPAACANPNAVCDDPEATYGLAFRYPADEAASREVARRAEAEQRRIQWEAERPIREARLEATRHNAMVARLQTAQFEGGECRNWRYEAQANAEGRARIVPDRVTDNGRETVFVYEGERQVPAFYLPAADGKSETPIRADRRGSDGYVLPVVASEIRLRLGDAVVAVFNRAALSPACVTGTMTTSAEVARVVRTAATPRGAPR